MKQFNNGYSILETIVVTSILGIGIASAAPSLSDFVNRSKVDSVKNQLFSALSFARMAAIAEQQDTHVCALSYSPSGDYQCGSYSTFNSSWSKGWLVFTDSNNNYQFDGENELIKVYENGSSVKVVMNQRGRLRFRANGMARSTGFYICDLQDQNHHHVLLLHTGRARTKAFLDASQRRKCQTA